MMNDNKSVNDGRDPRIRQSTHSRMIVNEDGEREKVRFVKPE